LPGRTASGPMGGGRCTREEGALSSAEILVISGASDQIVSLISHCRGLVLTGSLALAAARGFGGAAASLAGGPNPLPDVIREDTVRASALLSSPAPERRIEGIQELSNLKDWAAEEAILRLLEDVSPAVRREAVLALGRLGTSRAVPAMIRLLEDPSWELRQNAWLELGRMTAQVLPAGQRRAWQAWWGEEAGAAKETALLAALRAGPMRRPGGRRCAPFGIWPRPQVNRICFSGPAFPSSRL